MKDVIFRNAADRRSQLTQDTGEQTEVDVHVDRPANILVPHALEDQGEAGGIEMRFKSRRALERSDIELVGVFEGDFRLVRNRLRHVSKLASSDKPRRLSNTSFEIGQTLSLIHI